MTILEVGKTYCSTYNKEYQYKCLAVHEKSAWIIRVADAYSIYTYPRETDMLVPYVEPVKIYVQLWKRRDGKIHSISSVNVNDSKSSLEYRLGAGETLLKKHELSYEP